MTIVEFLNARLDDQEADGRALDYLQTGEFLLADAAAKRRMTERAWLSVQYLPPEMRTPAGDAAAFHAFWVLGELASVYAEHPDYDLAWKP